MPHSQRCRICPLNLWPDLPLREGEQLAADKPRPGIIGGSNHKIPALTRDWTHNLARDWTHNLPVSGWTLYHRAGLKGDKRIQSDKDSVGFSWPAGVFPPTADNSSVSVEGLWPWLLSQMAWVGVINEPQWVTDVGLTSWPPVVLAQALGPS